MKHWVLRFGWLSGVAILVMGVFVPLRAQAAVCTSQGTGNWNTSGTWDCGHVPTSSDSVVIANTHTVTVDVNTATVTSVTINSGGTLTEDGNGRTITESGGWTNNGTFTANQSTVKFAGNQTFTGSTTFKNLTIDTNSNSGLSVTMTGYTATTTGTFTFNNSLSGAMRLIGGTVAAQGDISWDAADAPSNMTGTLLVSGSSGQTLTTSNATRTAGNLMPLVVNKTGTLTLSGDVRSEYDWTLTAGSIDATTNTTTVVLVSTGNLTITGSQTFYNLTLDPNSTGTRGYTIASGSTLTVSHNFILQSSSVGAGITGIATGNLVLQGDITWDNDDTNGGTQTVAVTISGSNSQALTFVGGSVTTGRFASTTINKTGGTLTVSGIARMNSHFSHLAGTVDWTTNSTTLVFSASTAITVNPAASTTYNNVRFDQNSASSQVVTMPSGTTMKIAGTLTIDNTSSGAIRIDGGTLEAQGDVAIDTGNVFSTFTEGLLIDGSGTQALTLTGGSATSGNFASTTIAKTGGTLTVSGVLRTAKNFTVSSGTVDWTTSSSTISFAGTSNFNPAAGNTYDNIYFDTAGAVTLQSNLAIARDWTNNGSFTSGSNTVTFTGTGTSTVITGGTSATKDFQTFTVNKSGSGTVVLSTNGLDVDGTLTVSGGTLDLNGQSVTTTTTCSVTGTLKLTAGESVSCTPTFNAGSTAEYYATTTVSRAINNWTYKNLKFSGVSGGTFTDGTSRTVAETLLVTAGTFQPTATLAVTATTTISGGTLSAGSATLDFNSDVVISGGVFTAPSGTATVAGNWTHSSGTFTHNSGTVTFDGTNQIIGGNNSWNNLTKSVTAARSLTFDHTATQTVAGLLTLSGTLGNLLTLQSDTAGQYWGLTANGTFAITYVTVSDSNASGGSQVTQTNSTDGGHNLNWTFNQTPTVSSLGPTQYVNGSYTTDNTPTLTFTTADGDGDTLAYQLQIDNNSNFGSPEVDTSSSYHAGTTESYTPSTLSDGSYYWRVRVGDGTATSSYSTANAGAVAFIVDVTDPSVSLTAPTNGSYASGTVALTATASDGVSLVGVQFVRDTTTLIGSEDTSNPFTGSWDTTAVADGSHTLQAVARDAAGHYATSSITVTVDNTAPTISGESPTGTQPAGTTQVSLAVTTNEAATCKYATSSGIAYASMIAFGTTGSTSHSQTITGLANAQSYNYYVKCRDGAGNTSIEDHITFDVADGNAPTVSLTAPTNGATVTGVSVTLSATASDDGTVMGVQFKRDGTTAIGAEDTSAPYSVNWDSTGVSDGSHTLQAVARDNDGKYATSTITVTVDNTAPTFSSIATSSVTGTSIVISWNTNEAATSQVEYGLTTSYGSVSTLDSSLVSNHSVTLSGLTPYTAYHYRLASTDGAGNHASSSDQTFTTLDSAAPTPGSISFSGVTTTGITASSTGASDAQSGLATTPFSYHNITRDTSSGATATTWSETGLTPNTSYSYEIGVVDQSGNWATTTPVATTTLANPPASLTLIVNSSSALTASWSGNGNPAGTEYYVDNTTAGTNSGWVAATSYQFTGLTASTSYSITVKARNGGGVETASVSASATTSEASATEETTSSSRSGTSGGRRPSSNSTATTVSNLTALLTQLSHTLQLATTPITVPGTPLPPIGSTDSEASKLVVPVFGAQWQLLSSEPLSRFVFAPLPTTFADLVAKFPSLKQTLDATGIATLQNYQQLKEVEFKLPTIADQAKETLPLASLSPAVKKAVPSEVLFVRSSNERVDLTSTLKIDAAGTPAQEVRTLSGQNLVLAIKPAGPATAVSGFLLFKGRDPQAAASVATVPSWWGGVASAQELPIEQGLVVQQFQFHDDDSDGIYTAAIQAPVAVGNYEVLTAIDYRDPAVGRRLVRLVAVVDPEGYVYEQIGSNQLRVAKAIVTLQTAGAGSDQFALWPAAKFDQQNPQTTGVSGSYAFLVPPGRYRLVVEAPGYQPYAGAAFEVQLGRGVHENIALTRVHHWYDWLEWHWVLGILVLAILVYWIGYRKGHH